MEDDQPIGVQLIEAGGSAWMCRWAIYRINGTKEETTKEDKAEQYKRQLRKLAKETNSEMLDTWVIIRLKGPLYESMFKSYWDNYQALQK